jgi:hypothetical protein
MVQARAAGGAESIETQGDYSPGIVMGDFIVHGAPRSSASLTLADAFRLAIEFRPSDRGFLVTIDDGRQVFVGGCKFDMRISNAGTSDFVLRLLHVAVEVEDFDIAQLRDKNRLYAGVFAPHQLFIDLRRQSTTGWWLLSNGVGHSDPRPFNDARQDLLASEGQPRLQFRISPGELEVIEGAITPREHGLYSLRFVFGVATADDKSSRETAVIYLTRGDLSDGA